MCLNWHCDRYHSESGNSHGAVRHLLRTNSFQRADVEIAAKTGLDDMIVPDRAESRSLLGLVEAIEDIVILAAACQL